MTKLPRLTRQRPAAKPGIVHLGPGAFFKAFTAIYTDDVLRASGGDWGIIAVSLQSSRAADALAPQGHVYTAVSMAPEGEDARVIEAIVDVLVAPERLAAVINAMATPEIKIVSLTITEKGYCYNPATGGLQLDHPGVQYDLAHPDAPQTALGFIVAALARRRAAGARPFTVLSCDNLPDNGTIARGVVVEFARQLDPALADWIDAEGRFPATMVDRITPATTAQDIERLSQHSGYHDPACVYHEPFRQWVIEDDFVDGARPEWSKGGAQFVDDVTDHEAMKLRCLNGTHSTLAYLGYLAGHETIAQTVADPPFACLCERLWMDEILPTLRAPEGEDLPRYTAALLARYCNTAIRHRTWQIAMDGSQKLPQRLLGTIMDNRSAGWRAPGLCLAVAGWMRYVSGVDEKGLPIDVRDPLAEQLKTAADQAGDGAGIVAALLSFAEIFPAGLVADATFASDVLEAYRRLEQRGARETVLEFVQTKAPSD